MLQAIVKKGKVIAESIPAPIVSDGSLLIKVVNSCISAGTEISGVQASSKSLIKKAIEQPEKLMKILDFAKSNGIIEAYNKVKNNQEMGYPTGYSISGVVIGVGKGVNKFQIGDHVTAAGAGVANHAEYVDVPVNLVVKMPSGLDFKPASTVALGAIALHGVRRASLNLGEFGIVFGAGILGLLTIQMLKLSGVRIIAIDINPERLKIAKELGAELIVNPLQEDAINEVQNFTGGYGADAVLFSAATHNSEPLSQAFKMCKKKGKVVLLGVAGMQLKREDMYEKELDFIISTSYGPGRYDKKYEQEGMEYPYAYVRWTENRNMTEYLRLVHNGSIKLENLIQASFPAEKCGDAFESLGGSETKPLIVVLDYGAIDLNELGSYLNHDRKIFINSLSHSKSDVVNIGLIGIGSFATSMHIPHIAKLKDKYRLRALMNRTGNKAKDIGKQNNVAYVTSNYKDILEDPEIDLIMICTRHNSHAELVLRGLQAGKHVFVEKPLSTNKEDLNRIMQFYGNDIKSKPLLMVGFNRRFSKYALEVKKHTCKRINPLFIHYRMNAGYISADHWAHEDGGRIVGEACHIIDLMTFFTESEISSISYESLNPSNDKYRIEDNKSMILKYKDGSVCTIEYFAIGNKAFPKEYMEVHFDEKTIVMEDYKSLKGYGLKINELSSVNSEKGQLEELVYLYEALKGNTRAWPIEFWDMVQTTQISLEVM